MNFCSDIQIEPPERTASRADPLLDSSPHIYAGLLLRTKRPTQAMRAWVRHVFRNPGSRRYRSSPAIFTDPS